MNTATAPTGPGRSGPQGTDEAEILGSAPEAARLSDHDYDRLKRGTALTVAFVIGLTIGIVGTVIYHRIGGLDLGAGGPMDKVTTISKSAPHGGTDLRVAETRLGNATDDADWGLEFFSADPEDRDNPPLAPVLADLREIVAIPDVQDARVRAVMTNVFDDKSVARNGALVMVAFHLQFDVRTWFTSDPVVFQDEAVEEARDAYWVGDWAVVYSPHRADTDQTEGLRDFLKLYTHCFETLAPCNVDRSIKDFDDWAPRGAGGETVDGD